MLPAPQGLAPGGAAMFAKSCIQKTPESNKKASTHLSPNRWRTNTPVGQSESKQAIKCPLPHQGCPVCGTTLFQRLVLQNPDKISSRILFLKLRGICCYTKCPKAITAESQGIRILTRRTFFALGNGGVMRSKKVSRADSKLAATSRGKFLRDLSAGSCSRDAILAKCPVSLHTASMCQ